MKKRLAIKIFTFLIIAGAVFYWVRFFPVKVQAHKVTRGPVVNKVMGTGTLEAKIRASISPEISGLLTKVLADQNDKIAKGQLLACLDDADLLQQVEVAKADLAAAKATVDRTGADIISANATAVKARSNFERILTLRKSHAVAENELEKAVESRDVAESNLNRAQLAKIEAERNVSKAEASLRYWQARLDDTKLYAPFDGLVVRRNRDPGAVIVPGTSIMDVVSTEQLWISAWVDETAIELLKTGQPARVVFRSSPGKFLEGEVLRLASETDRETREFIADVGLKDLPERWAVGQRAEVYIETERKKDVVFIPQNFVIWRGKEAGVMLDVNGKVQWRKVSLGLSGRGNVEINGGLAEGDVIINAFPGSSQPREGRAIKYDKL